MYISRYWDLYVTPGCTIQLASFWIFLPLSACWSCHCLSYGWVPSLPLLVLGFVYIGQDKTIQFVGTWISFLDFYTRYKFNIWAFLTFPHLIDCLICTRSACPLCLYYKWWVDGIGRRWFIYIKVWVGGLAVSIIVSFLFFFLVFLYFLGSHAQSLCLGEWWLLCLFLCFLCLWSL